jgi:hypothetical protein
VEPVIRIEESGTPVDALADALEVLDDTEALARAMAATASELVRSTFSATRSPDGLPWRPVVRPPRGHWRRAPPLRRSARRGVAGLP